MQPFSRDKRHRTSPAKGKATTSLLHCDAKPEWLRLHANSISQVRTQNIKSDFELRTAALLKKNTRTSNTRKQHMKTTKSTNNAPHTETKQKDTQRFDFHQKGTAAPKTHNYVKCKPKSSWAMRHSTAWFWTISIGINSAASHHGMPYLKRRYAPKNPTGQQPCINTSIASYHGMPYPKRRYAPKTLKCQQPCITTSRASHHSMPYPKRR